MRQHLIALEKRERTKDRTKRMSNKEERARERKKNRTKVIESLGKTRKDKRLDEENINTEENKRKEGKE